MTHAINSDTPCPCGSGQSYAHCCARLHQGQSAADAEQLMRSRYSAYVLQMEGYLLATWHASTRPAALHLSTQNPVPTWLGLSVRAHHIDDAEHARVEFVARFRVGGGKAQRLHERSRFVHEDGVWFYVDGDID